MRLAVALSLLLAPALVSAASYSGSECVGFIDFELENDAGKVATAENGVAMLMNGAVFPKLIPMWLRQQCTTQLRRFLCLDKFTPIAETPTTMCASVCEDLIQRECRDFLDAAPALDQAWTLVLGVPSDCSVLPASGCTVGGEYTMFPQDEAVCPRPLRKTHPFVNSYEDILAPALLDISDCNTKCPTYVYDSGEWENMKATVQAFVWLSLIVSIAIFVSLIVLKKLQVLNAAFLLSCIGASFGMVVLILSGQDRIYCEDEVYVHDRAPICVAQGFLTIVCSIAIAMTITCQAIDTYLRVVRGFKGDKVRYLNYAYLAVIVVFPLICASVALGADNVGFDTFWLMPMCFYRRTVSLYYVRYLFMLPQIIALSVCAVLVILTSTRTIRLLARGVVVQQRTGKSESSEHTSTHASLGRSLSDRPPLRCCRSSKAMAVWKKLVQYNVQSSIFVLAYCALSAGCLLAVITREQSFSDITKNTIEHVSCIIESSAQTGTVDSGIDQCGSFPEDIPPLSRQGFLAAFYGGPGVFAFLIYAPTLLTAMRLLVKDNNSTTQNRSKFLSSVAVTSDTKQMLPNWQQGASELPNRELSLRVRSHMEMVSTSPRGSQPRSPSVASTSMGEPARTDLSKSDPPTSTSLNHSGQESNSAIKAEFKEGDKIEVGDEPIAQVVQHLGQGQFGNVYCVDAAWTTKQLAMKCARIPDKDSVSGDSNGRADKLARSIHDIKQFCEEARTSLHVGAHYNIVSLRYVCENNTAGAASNQFLLFYDLVDGTTLLSHLQNRRRSWMGSEKSLEDVQRHLFSLTYQLINGLEWLHSRQVIHFDIKPDNLLVDSSGTRLQITDFGLARVCQDQDDDDQPVHRFPGGTPAYRSPEVAALQQKSGRSAVLGPKSTDLWAAALTVLQIYSAGSCPWYINAPKASPGEYGTEGMTRFQTLKKDQLFTASSWQDLFGRRKSFVETVSSAMFTNGGLLERLGELPVRDVLGFMIHEQHATFKSEMGLSKGDVMKLRRLAHEMTVFSMPPALENLVADALSSTIDNRPISVEEWKSRLLEPAKDEAVPAFQQSVVDEIDCQKVDAVADRDMAISFVNIGLALHQVDQHKTARSCYLRALELDPSTATASALYNLATSCYAIGETAETKRYLLQALEFDPTYARAYYTLSKFSRDERNLPEMAQYLRQSIEHDAKNKLWKAHWKYGRVQRLLGGPGAAIACYQQCIAQFAHCPHTHAYLALELYLAKRVEEALKHARTAVDMDPKNLVGNYVIALVLLVHRETRDAQQRLERLQQWHGNAVHFSMGDVFWAYGADHAAADAYTLASAYDPQNVELSSRVQELVSGVNRHPSPEEALAWVMSRPHRNLLV